MTSFVWLVAACGRFEFSRIQDAGADIDADAGTGADAGLAECLTDTFDTGDASAWIVIDPAWTIDPTGGPDGSPAYAVLVPTSSSMVTHPALYGVDAVQLSLDVRIDGATNGDFNVYLVEPGWTNPEDVSTSHYNVGLHPQGSDNTTDEILEQTATKFIVLDQRPTTVSAGTWHHLDLARSADGTIDLKLDGGDYLHSGPNLEIPAPLDLVLRFYDHGKIDNVSLRCTR